ncbi:MULTISPECIES: YjcZ family sporulation protein [unclassified Paenibacillus]
MAYILGGANCGPWEGHCGNNSTGVVLVLFILLVIILCSGFFGVF